MTWELNGQELNVVGKFRRQTVEDRRSAARVGQTHEAQARVRVWTRALHPSLAVREVSLPVRNSSLAGPLLWLHRRAI